MKSVLKIGLSAGVNLWFMEMRLSQRVVFIHSEYNPEPGSGSGLLLYVDLVLVR